MRKFFSFLIVMSGICFIPINTLQSADSDVIHIQKGSSDHTLSLELPKDENISGLLMRTSKAMFSILLDGMWNDPEYSKMVQFKQVVQDLTLMKAYWQESCQKNSNPQKEEIEDLLIFTEGTVHAEYCHPHVSILDGNQNPNIAVIFKLYGNTKGFIYLVFKKTGQLDLITVNPRNDSFSSEKEADFDDMFRKLSSQRLSR